MPDWTNKAIAICAVLGLIGAIVYFLAEHAAEAAVKPLEARVNGVDIQVAVYGSKVLSILDRLDQIERNQRQMIGRLPPAGFWCQNSDDC